ncbi:30S ribosomal protein S3 [Candidatus Falkowbacteria bacterium RIFOXYD2_FULL_35_9]|uniref:Small ribosomal subunit protein uS3 n=1 Tax=Candidatus Falkowbacteria bacterium RIFOXYC2_FULL_36_12 TaxID=1798002 RepID=A0A1F5SW67_9BACT|nr:MAG: 30S ribosomal protein S3 [Candidatus Falkowbacteria bacterium RIFOXYB2_FULL_35_7]OGF30975.1 MAG: 30S ribosomal protein S3 [Candidatus Falkowbacteria bacterium RIFOXYC2_FULL_36_12]OGF34403.1 MAG: 30S ribosomal protein S3 [Candidatus Falkowbacteria bacterium RIFOXYA2_FULL_35_8]OGF47300.1 MAG: 30S ribosomal protein S3 [Candidatus Falkowbacteria bacterium RIFOXYD2_FULL_35_9]
MGKKINPKIFRIKSILKWESSWFADKDYSKFLQQDVKIRAFLKKHLLEAFVSRIEIERSSKELNVIIHSARPGVVIGKSGAGVEILKKTISRQFVKDKNVKVSVNIKEIGKPNIEAALIAQGLKFDIEKRMPYRRAMKQVIQRVERAGAKGVKVIVAGRLNGAEIARREMLVSGTIPLHTIRANIDYAEEKANTTYGTIGIKVWIYKGDVFKKTAKEEMEETMKNKDEVNKSEKRGKVNSVEKA